MSAIRDIVLFTGRPNYRWARNTNPSRDIRLTYKVTGLANGPRTYTKDIPAGCEKELGVIDAGRGQRLSYSKRGARYLN